MSSLGYLQRITSIRVSKVTACHSFSKYVLFYWETPLCILGPRHSQLLDIKYTGILLAMNLNVSSPLGHQKLHWRQPQQNCSGHFILLNGARPSQRTYRRLSPILAAAFWKFWSNFKIESLCFENEDLPAVLLSALSEVSPLTSYGTCPMKPPKTTSTYSTSNSL